MEKNSADRELAFTPVHELAAMIKNKKLSPVELMEAVFRRIDELNPKLNAFLTLAEQDAMDSAKKAEELLSKKTDLGPLHGMPVGVKDLYNTKGIRTTYGSLVYRENVPEEDGILTRRLKAAGARSVPARSTRPTLRAASDRAPGPRKYRAAPGRYRAGRSSRRAGAAHRPPGPRSAVRSPPATPRRSGTARGRDVRAAPSGADREC